MDPGAQPLGKKILIAEDETAILDGIAEKFSLAGFDVKKAKNGEEGLAQALADRPDLILLDYRMPIMDGFTMLEKLREDVWGKNARVIFWSNSHGQEVQERARKLGVIDILTKSDWEFKDVVKRVKEKLGVA